MTVLSDVHKYAKSLELQSVDTNPSHLVAISL